MIISFIFPILNCWFPGCPPTNFDLMSAMMQRVTLLEKTVRSHAKEIERKVSMQPLQRIPKLPAIL